MDELLAAFEGPIKRVRISIIYQLGLLLVALAMIALPLIYLGMIAVVGYGVFYHATENVQVFQEAGSKRGAALVYVTPILVGVLVIFFMIKPLLAKRPH